MVKLRSTRPHLLGISILLIFTLNTLSGNTFSYLRPGMAAPDFSLEDFSGRRGTLQEELHPQTVIIVFWASWSKRSLEELSDLERFGQQWGNTDYKVLAINVENQALTMERKDSLRSLVAGMEVSHTFFFDDGLSVFREYGVIAVPSTMIIDKTSTILTAVNGYSRKARSDLEDSLKAFLGLLPAEIAHVDTPIYKPAKKAELHFNLGRRLLRSKKFDKAAAQFNEAIGLDSGFIQPLISLGEALEGQGKNSEAEEVYARVLTLDPHSALALWRLGSLANTAGNKEKALEYIERALLEDENLYLALIERAYIEMEQGDLEAADKDIELANEANTIDVHVKAAKADLAELNGNLETASQLLRAAVEELLEP